MPQVLGGGRLGGGAEEDRGFYSQGVGPLGVEPVFCLHFRGPLCWESVGWEPRGEALSPSRERGWQAGAWSGWQQQRGESVSGPEGGGAEGPLGHLRGSQARACDRPADEECQPEPAGFPSPSCMAGPGPAVSVGASDTTPTWPGHSSACCALQRACWERPSCWQPGAGWA